MKRISTLFLSSLFSMIALAEGSITLTTNAPVGTEIKMTVQVLSKNKPVTVDWGNGVETKTTIDPAQGAYNRKVNGTVEGGTITIKGDVTQLECSEAGFTSAKVDGMTSLEKLKLQNNEIESFELLTPTPLTELKLSNNRLSNSTSYMANMSLDKAGSTLVDLDLSGNNGLICFDARDLTELTYLYLNDCPNLASVFICAPEESREKLRQIKIANCMLSHFYPVDLPALRVLDLSNNILTTNDGDDFRLGNYPALNQLDISNNKYITELDVTACPAITKIYASGCGLSELNLSKNPELQTLNIGDNNISSIDLSANAALQDLYINGNPISKIDLTILPRLQSLNISDTQISRVDLYKSFYLNDFRASNSKLEFVDFNGQQQDRMMRIDLRDCPNFTYESMAYTCKTMPSGRERNARLYLSGSNAEHADLDRLRKTDQHWEIDIEGDGTATHDPIDVNILDATDTGENKQGSVKLWDYMGYVMNYDFDVMQTEGGKFIISQWLPEWFETMNSVSTKALKGIPVHIHAYPEEGLRFKSVTVGDKEIASPWFIISEPCDIKVNFAPAESSMTFTAPAGQNITMLVMTAEENGTVAVDWGTGGRTEYSGLRKYETGVVELKGTRIEGTPVNGTFTVYGDVSAIDLGGFGPDGEFLGLWDNAISSANISSNPDLKYLNLFWCPVSALDLSKNTKLEVLDISMTNLSTLDLSNNTALIWLEAYSDGFGDPDDNIALRKVLDISMLPHLQYLDIHNNKMQTLDLGGNNSLHWLNAGGNQLTSIELNNAPQLLTLDISRNKLTSIDLAANTMLTGLSVEANDLTNLDLSHNLLLTELGFADNLIKSIDLSEHTALQNISMTGNGMNAEQMNDFYYTLPVRTDNGETGVPGTQLPYNLLVYRAGDREANEAMRADSSIAEDRLWTPSHQGTNGGADNAYLDILPCANGTIKVVDESGNEYTTGSKVPKYIKLNIIATPAEGYEFKSYSLNGETTVGETSFDMPGIYSKLAVSFGISSGIDEITTESISAEYFDIYGRPVTKPSTGVYIIRRGDKTIKAFVK